MTDTFTEAIKQRDEQYRKDIESAKTAKDTVAKDYEDLKASVADLEEKLGAANERISKFENEQRAEEAVASFNERMDSLDQLFQLDDEDREFLAKEVKEIEAEEAYASFVNKLEVLWKHKNKEVQASFDAEIQARIDAEVAKRIEASANEEVATEDALDGAEATDSVVSNANEAVSAAEPSLKDKFKDAFKRENIEIS